MSWVIIKDRVELSSIFPDVSHIDNYEQFLADNSSLSFTIDDQFVDVPWDTSENDIVMVVGVNQQTQQRYIAEYISGGETSYGSTWVEGYYKIFVRKYKRPTNSDDYINLIDSNDFFELTKHEIFWNKSILSFMVYIQPGTFLMGSPETEVGRSEEETQHKVTITEGFYIGRTVLTNGLFNAVMSGIKPVSDLTSITVDSSSVNTCFSLTNTYWDWYRETDKDDNFGRVYISYNKYQSDSTTRDGDYSGFGRCTLNNQDSWYPYPYLKNDYLPSGETDKSFITQINTIVPIVNYTWDIPTEAQWEYTCRSGKKSAFNNGENLIEDAIETEAYYITEPQIHEICWYRMHDGQRHECALLKCSDWGLFDCHGNNWEWVKDFYNGPHYPDSNIDPYQAEYIPGEVADKYGDNSDKKVIRGGWAGWKAKACRSAYRNKDYTSAVAPSYGARLILRKGVLDVTISPTDVTVCGDTTVTSELCSYTLSRSLIGNNNTINVTYSINNVNNTIAISNASIVYNGRETYSYNVSIGPNANIIRLPKEQKELILTPLFTSKVCMEDSTTYPTANNLGLMINGSLNGGDTITNISYSVNLPQNNNIFTCSISNYEVDKIEEGCYEYSVTTNKLYVTGEECTQTYPLSISPKNFSICNDGTVPTSDDCGYDITSGILLPGDYIDNIQYSISGNSYTISSAEVISASNSYNYDLSYSGTGTITKTTVETQSCAIKVVARIIDASNPLYKDDSLETLKSKISVNWDVEGFREGDGAANVTFSFVKNTNSLSITVDHYDILTNHIYDGDCHVYNVSTPTINLQLIDHNVPDPVFNITISPKASESICPVGSTPSAVNCGYNAIGNLAEGDVVVPDYNISGLQFNLTNNTTITKNGTGYSYNITVDTTPISFNLINYETKSVTIKPVFNSNKIVVFDTNPPVESDFSYNANGFVNGDYLTNITYSIEKISPDSGSNGSGSNDSGSESTASYKCTITSYNVHKSENGCYTYNISASPYYIHSLYLSPIFSGSSFCSTKTPTQDEFNVYVWGFKGEYGTENISSLGVTINNTNHTVKAKLENDTKINSNYINDWWYGVTLGENNFSSNVIEPGDITLRYKPVLTIPDEGSDLNHTLLTTDSDSIISTKTGIVNNTNNYYSLVCENESAKQTGDSIELTNVTYSFTRTDNYITITATATPVINAVTCNNYTVEIGSTVYYLYYPVIVTADNMSVCKDINVDNNTVGVGFTVTGTSVNNIENVVYDFANANTNKGTTASDSYTITSYNVKDTQNKYYKQIGNTAVITRTNCESTPTLTISIDTSCICDPDGIYSKTDIIDESNEPGVVTTTFTGLSGGDSLSTSLSFNTTATIQTTNN